MCSFNLKNRACTKVRSGQLLEKKTAYYIRQTIQALIHLHQNGIIHRDIKPENIVLVSDVVKLADFGWSTYITKQ